MQLSNYPTHLFLLCTPPRVLLPFPIKSFFFLSKYYSKHVYIFKKTNLCYITKKINNKTYAMEIKKINNKTYL